MIRVLQCKIKPSSDTIREHRIVVAHILRCNPEDIQKIEIEKKSIDARKKPDVFYLYSFLVTCKSEKNILKRNLKNKNIQAYQKPLNYRTLIQKSISNHVKKTVIVGAGPAGLFAAYELALAGCCPIIIERGEQIEHRITDVEAFFTTGVLNPDSNVVFGEGGAGTFSDGKLNTGVKEKSGRIPFILKTFVECGAPEEITYLAKPHIGTDILQKVIVNLRKNIEKLGGCFHFNAKMEQLLVTNNVIRGIVYRDSDGVKTLSCDHCILAIGHGARDTFEYLYQSKVPMEQKNFAVGVRVEHRQAHINKIQYDIEQPEHLPAADYKLTAKAKDGRGIYSFCMCPGGYVVNASSEDGHLVVNGMSNHDRAGENANSAIVVTVDKQDFKSEAVLAGIDYQRTLERKAWQLANGNIPVQKLIDFKQNKPSTALGKVTPSTKGDYSLTNVRSILPINIGDAILEGFECFGRKMKGFDDDDTMIAGVETRTSSPVRILRNELLESNIQGLYPCGEGAGYAGGIMSAAVDGLKVATQIRKNMEDK